MKMLHIYLLISYLLAASANIEVGDSWRTWQGEDRVVGEAGHPPGSHQQGGRDEAEGGVDHGPLHDPPPLHQVAD